MSIVGMESGSEASSQARQTRFLIFIAICVGIVGVLLIVGIILLKKASVKTKIV